MNPLRVTHDPTLIDGSWFVIRTLTGGPMFPDGHTVVFACAGPFDSQVECEAAATLAASGVRIMLEELGLAHQHYTADNPEPP